MAVAPGTNVPTGTQHTDDYSAVSAVNVSNPNFIDYGTLLDYFGKGTKTNAQKQLLSDMMQNLYNSAEAAKSRNWQEYMSNTSYQRAMQDLAAAGINPALAYQQGGASTPSGATASGGYTTKSGESFIGSLGQALMTTAVSAAGGIAGKAIGAKIAASNSSELMAQKLSNQMKTATLVEQYKKENRHSSYLASTGGRSGRRHF